MGKRSSATATSKISSASALTTTSTSTNTNKSSILKSSFAPSYLQLRLFASVIQSFDSQQLRIHDVSSGRLRQQHNVSGSDVTCLDWGYYGVAYRENRSSSKKKRKRTNEQENAVVAYGTSSGDVCMFSPSQGSVVGTLKAGHDRDVRDFRFVPEDNLQAWSIGSEGKLVQWDLRNDKVMRTISIADTSLKTLAAPSTSVPQLLCASGTPRAMTIGDGDEVQTDVFDSFKHLVHSLFRSGTGSKSNGTFLAADEDRYINVYDLTQKKIVRTLVAGSEVQKVEVHYPTSTEDQMLAVTTRDGTIELFSKPFDIPQAVNGDLKSKRKGLTRKADATVKLIGGTADKKQYSAHAVTFDAHNLIVVSMEGGAEPVFQKLRWQDEGSGELLFDGVQELVKAKSASTLNTASLSGAKDMGQTHVNDAKTVVVNGLAESGSQIAPVEIDDSSDNDEEEDEGAKVPATDDESDADSDEEMEDAAEDLEGTTAGDGEDVEPSFGDLLAAKHPELISVKDNLLVDEKALAQLSDSKQLMLPSGMSLGTVLTQSLKTNDQSLLETCLHVTDEKIVQNTILRLESSLAANLLTKLAERLADRPGRYGHLLTWVQSTMIAHGGAIASQAGVASKLRTLYQVLNERSKILPSILLLKGKLDMMNAQQEFRAQASAHRSGIQYPEVPTYIEGQGDSDWSSSDEDMDEDQPRRTKGPKDLDDVLGDRESSDDEDMPLVNGVGVETDDSDASNEEEPPRTRLNGVVDVEAGVSGEDQSDEETDETGSEEEDDEDEDDSEMDSFINDGQTSVDEDDAMLDDEPEKPAKKKSKHR